MYLRQGLHLGANSTSNVASQALTHGNGTQSTRQLDPTIDLKSLESFSFEGSKTSAFRDHFDNMKEKVHGVSSGSVNTNPFSKTNDLNFNMPLKFVFCNMHGA